MLSSKSTKRGFGSVGSCPQCGHSYFTRRKLPNCEECGYDLGSLGGYWELTNACRSGVGRFPMQTKTKCRAIKYWLKFCEAEHQNKLSGIAFTDQIGQDKKELWPSKLKRLQV